jgi:2-methylcitrate dehydratase PrpD
MTLVQDLAGFAVAARDDGVPDEVAASVRRRVLDIVGLCVAALPLDTSRAVIDYAAGNGGTPQAHAVGLSQRLPAAQAAFVNGVLAHSLDYDDTHLPSILHPSASVVPATLAAAQCAGADGATAARAIAAGIEITVRLGMAGYDRSAGNSTFFERGLHATSLCGAIGGAAAAALALGLGAEGVSHAMGLAVSMTGGVIEANRTGGTVKRLHCGWAAHAAVTAAELAARGFTGPPTVLEGRFGFYQAYLSGQFSAGEITGGLGETWSVPSIHFKPYPANHFTHAGIDAALALRGSGLRAEDVDHAVLGVAAPTVRTIGEPLADKQRPLSGYHAKFSGPYTVASALLGGSGLGLGLGHDDFTDEAAADPARLALAARVTVVADTECDRRYPDALPAVLTVTTRSGETLVERVLTNRGGPDNPLSDAELAAKFTDNAARVLPADAVEDVRAAASALDSLTDLADLLVPTAKER